MCGDPFQGSLLTNVLCEMKHGQADRRQPSFGRIPVGFLCPIALLKKLATLVRKARVAHPPLRLATKLGSPLPQ